MGLNSKMLMVMAGLAAFMPAAAAEREARTTRSTIMCTSFASWREFGLASLRPSGAAYGTLCPRRLPVRSIVVVVDNDAGFGAAEISYRGKRFFIDADALEFEGVENTADFGEENIAAQQISEGKIPMIYIQNSDKQQLWEGKFVFRAKTNTTWAKSLHLASTALANEAYGQTAASESIEKYDLKIQFHQPNGQVAEAESKLELYQNRPNPFAENTVIAYALPKAGSVRLRVFTAAGAVLYDRRLESSEGYNEIMLYRKDLPSSGVLYYEVASEQGNAVRKMILE